MAALKYVAVPGYRALLFRRTFADLNLPGALMDRARDWLGGTAARWNAHGHVWSFPSGATLTFGYLETENDKYRYQSSELQYIGFDELTQFGESQYLYLFSRLRRLAGSEVPLRMRSASNPGGLGHEWVRARFIDTEPADGRLFIPARLADNPHLDGELYRENLSELDAVTRAQLLEGDWQVRPEGALFKRDWFCCGRGAPRPGATGALLGQGGHRGRRGAQRRGADRPHRPGPLLHRGCGLWAVVGPQARADHARHRRA